MGLIRMDRVAREELELLAGNVDEVCVSIYLPTHRAGMETQQGAIRLKNLLKKAEELRPLTSLRPAQMRALLEPAQNLITDTLFWQYQDEGLALFLSPEGMRSYRLPIRFDELVVVGRRFHVKPILPLLSADGRFFILAISRSRVRLLRCTRYRFDEVDLPSVPANISDALQIDEAGKELQFHTRTSPAAGAGRRQAIFHGHGAGEDEDKTNLLRYFHRIDRGLQEVLRDEHSPLVLAGVGYLFPIYREANTYQHLLDEGIEGNPDELSAAEIHGKAWEIVRPLFMKKQEEAAAKFERFSKTGNGQASNDLEKVVPAAYSGRVDTLFVAAGAQRWGTFDPDSQRVELHEKPQAGDDDLLDLAAVQTFLNGGSVYTSDQGDIPGGSALAAVMRY
ncbi:MAG: hypothetical protein BWZ01_01036 [Deltaproteobacteria bacterium ADurb.BinA179]|nr:MAG: hypothetical protein BWZ01_01036 [Deltaproteobacteria bacterium ADurb.BinA179]